MSSTKFPRFIRNALRNSTWVRGRVLFHKPRQQLTKSASRPSGRHRTMYNEQQMAIMNTSDVSNTSAVKAILRWHYPSPAAQFCKKVNLGEPRIYRCVPWYLAFELPSGAVFWYLRTILAPKPELPLPPKANMSKVYCKRQHYLKL